MGFWAHVNIPYRIVSYRKVDSDGHSWLHFIDNNELRPLNFRVQCGPNNCTPTVFQQIVLQCGSIKLVL